MDTLDPEDDLLTSKTPNIRVVETNPLFIDQVVSKVFEFLDPVTLHDARRVCQMWNREGRRSLLKNDTLILRTPHAFHSDPEPPEELQDLTLALINLLDHSGHSDPISVRIGHHRDTQLFQTIPLLLDKITILEYDNSHSGPHEESAQSLDISRLASCLQKLPHLVILDTTCLNLSPNQSWLQEDDGPSKFESFLDKLASLRELRLNFWLNLSTLAFYTNFRVKLHAINSLRINSEAVFNLYTSEIGTEWKIQRLRLMINNEIPVEVIRHFLRGVSSTLRHLRLSFFFRRQPGFEVDPFDAWSLTDPFSHFSQIPWTLSSLETLDIYEDDPQLETSVWKTIGVSMELPKLERLVIRASITTQFDEMMRQWDRSRNRPLQSQSLEKLILWPKILSSPTILFTDCWPNLKSLIIKLEINQVTTAAAFFAIFSKLSRLHRLELFLTDEHSAGVRGLSKLSFDELLTGIRKPSGYRTGVVASQVELEQFKFRSLRNLEVLKCFKMECIACCELHGWTDFFIYHGVLHLKNLQSLQMTRKFISGGAMEDVRQEFGPNAHIHFYTQGQVVINVHSIF